MKLRDAIKAARKNKCRIQNNGFKVPMCMQDAKSLVYWLLEEPKTYKQSKKILKQLLKSESWKLDYEDT